MALYCLGLEGYPARRRHLHLSEVVLVDTFDD